MTKDQLRACQWQTAKIFNASGMVMQGPCQSCITVGVRVDRGQFQALLPPSSPQGQTPGTACNVPRRDFPRLHLRISRHRSPMDTSETRIASASTLVAPGCQCPDCEHAKLLELLFQPRSLSTSECRIRIAGRSLQCPLSRFGLQDSGPQRLSATSFWQWETRRRWMIEDA